MAVDPRAIRSRAYGRFNRVIGYNAPGLPGLLTKPYDNENPNGWGPPFDVLPGVPNASPNRVLFLRANPTDPPPSTLIRGQTFRAFENADVLDWRGLELLGREGSFPMLHFHGPPSRYFPAMEIISTGFLTFALQDRTSEKYQPFFYDRQGTIKIQGPGGNIVGVAIRNQLTALEEYIVATGFAGNEPSGYEFFVRSRTDPSQPWRKIGETGGFTATIGTGTKFASNTSWAVPLHFNRRGDRCVNVQLGKSNAGANQGHLFRLEVVISGDTVIPTLTDVTVGRVTTIRRRNGSSTDIDTTAVEDLPDCPTKGTHNTTTTIVTDHLAFSEIVTGPNPIAFDYKIGTDNVLGSVSVRELSQTSLTSSGGGTISTDQEACNDNGDLEVTPNTANGGGTTTLTGVTDNFRKVFFDLDGGENSGTAETLIALNQHQSITRTSVSTTVDSVTTVDTSVSVENLTGDELTRSFQYFWTFESEVMWADIRYGSLILGNRQMAHKNISFNSEAGVGIPGQDAGPSFIGPIVGSTSQLGVVGFISTPPPFVVWSEFFKFRRDTHVLSRDFNLKLRDEDGNYSVNANNVANLMLLMGTSLLPTSPPPEGTNEEIITADPDASPSFVTQTTALPAMADRGRGPMGAHDRFGEFFYQREFGSPQGDFSIARKFGSAFVYSPEIPERIASADYEFEDPVAAVEIPGAAPGFEPLVCV